MSERESSYWLICPYCETKHADAHEHFSDRSDTTTVECDGCGKPFAARQEVTITYTASTLFRADGWPFCPRCTNDELGSYVVLHGETGDRPPTVEECLQGRFFCYSCQWEGMVTTAPASPSAP